jgi:hypothetical protein
MGAAFRTSALAALHSLARGVIVARMKCGNGLASGTAAPAFHTGYEELRRTRTPDRNRSRGDEVADRPPGRAARGCPPALKLRLATNPAKPIFGRRRMAV